MKPTDKNCPQNTTLYEKLNSYGKSDFYPFHMPGHKRNMASGIKVMSGNNEYAGVWGKSPYEYDITEIDGFDNLHAPEGIIRDRQEQAGRFYGGKKTYYLVNGSTCGILAAISACCHGSGRKDIIIMGRNAHKSAYNAVMTNELEAVYIYPHMIPEYGIYGGINPEDVEAELRQQKKRGNIDRVCAVYITSPTYEGVVSDVRIISDICHTYNVPLIVDEAHGAHFGMNEKFPESALKLGADIVIQSLHKTLPALTQTAIMHIGKNAVIDEKAVERYLSVYETSSPSYVLMASIDECMDFVMGDCGGYFDNLAEKIEDFHRKVKNLNNIKMLDKDIVGKNYVYDFDMSKLVMFPDGNICDGKRLYEKLLEKYHLQMEMCSLKYIIGMTSVMDTEEGFDRLYDALKETDGEINKKTNKEESKEIVKAAYDISADSINPSPMAISDFRMKAYEKISDAICEEREWISLRQAEGRICGDFVYIYPPGVPVAVPGEIYTDKVLGYIEECIKKGMNVIGHNGAGCVPVIAEIGNETGESDNPDRK